ncbi:hypothetical protein RvY_12714-2 [Ramazzottius varieornatus]|uniref:Ribonuclease H1 n=1 Tax=Ramazzottius varieornatus TaxID=947166 RepID=A0A1D1VMF8_RAMVA|nr:hypothetical protein RvY_12714-2 [Ramazzottius varieornatus]
MPQFVYAVRVGRTPGIYKTWDECAEQVKAFSGARYKKFKTIEEAQAFIDDTDAPKNTTGGSPTNYQRKPPVAAAPQRPTPYTRPEKEGLLQPTDVNQTSKREFSTARRLCTTETVAVVDSHNVSSVSEDAPAEFSEEETAVVYTDGCCHNNGQEGALAGIGVYWGADSPLNIAEPLVGRATNNRAEIYAAVRAIAQAKELGKKKIVIYTDSQFLINSRYHTVGAKMDIEQLEAAQWKAGGQQGRLRRALGNYE